MPDGISGTDFDDYAANDRAENEGGQDRASDDCCLPIVLNQLLAQMHGGTRHVSGKDVVHGQRADNVHIARDKREQQSYKRLGPFAPRVAKDLS